MTFLINALLTVVVLILISGLFLVVGLGVVHAGLHPVALAGLAGVFGYVAYAVIVPPKS